MSRLLNLEHPKAQGFNKDFLIYKACLPLSFETKLVLYVKEIMQ